MHTPNILAAMIRMPSFFACITLALTLCVSFSAWAQGAADLDFAFGIAPGVTRSLDTQNSNAGKESTASEATPRAVRTGREKIGGYEPVIRGTLSDDLREIVTQSIDTFTLQEQPPPTRNLLKRRMHDDIPTIEKILSSLGYFKGSIKIKIEKGDDGKLRAIFRIDQGPRFAFGKLQIAPTEGAATDAPLPSPEEAGLFKGQAYRAKDVLDAQSYILKKLENNGYPFPKIAKRDVIANHKNDKVSVTYLVDSGPKAAFGPVTIKGLKYVDESYVKFKLTWKEGQPFDARVLENSRSALIQTGLFSMATMSREAVTPEGEVPITIDMVERKPRTVRAGLRYRTDTGIGGKVEWEHRTLFGQGEHFNAAIDADQTIQMLNLSLRKPSVGHDDLSLLVEQKVARERSDAFDGEWSLSSVGLEYRINDHLTSGAGVAYRLSRIDSGSDGEDAGEDGTFGLLSFPANLTWDSRNDILNPTKGWRWQVSGAPYIDTLGNAAHFLQGQASFTHYLNLVGEDTLILAVRALAGSTQGASLSDVPSDVRFYAGGGSSVRGFDYRKAGDLDKDGDPIGGLSVFESSAELRWRFLGDFGLVGFVDAGRAYEQEVPDIGDELFVGAGMGVRYYSFVGPVGVDVAIPVNGRDEDDNYQIYVSLGQSF